MPERRKLALILGSGFSRESGLPTTTGLSEDFLKKDSSSPLDRAISEILNTFWRDVFGYREHGGQLPLLEDHFTILDLAANSGHHLGSQYPPKKLRAIRRMSIHRVFQILDSKYTESSHSQRLLYGLLDSFEVSIVTLNWDIVIEKLLVDKAFDYGIDINWIDHTVGSNGKIPLLKMHGSSNWLYCDSCRQVHAGLGGKTALQAKAFLEPDDFALFGLSTEQVKSEIQQSESKRYCSSCGNRLAGRLATFSYRKAFSINQFQTIWERAHAELRRADIWLFVGYSLPQADFEFKHLLKSAQLGRAAANQWQCKVILKDDEDAANRYKAFWGTTDETIYREGLANWVGIHLNQFFADQTRNHDP